MPLAFPPDTQMFARDQIIKPVIEFWNTPFTALRNDIASGGIRFTMREPRGSAASWTSYVNSVVTSGTSLTDEAFEGGTDVRTVVSNGRTANLIGYWAGGAPGYHGASVQRSVAYRFEGWVRSASARDWFSASTSFTATVACAGYGSFKVVRTASGGGSTTILNVHITERGYLQTTGGGPFLSQPFTITTGDKFDFYYLQDQTPWGGFVFKLLPGAVADSQRARQLAMREGSIIGAGLVDDSGGVGAIQCPKQTLTLISDVQVTQTVNQTPQATFRVPLANTQTWDGVGWTWQHELGDDAGHLRLNDFVDNGVGGVTPVQIDVRRQRLVRIKGGFKRWDGLDEVYPLFTGFIDDFSDASSGVVTVRCLGVAQKLADQFVRNYPDKISYMTYGYQKLSGTSEPVYDTTAYDNWPMEYVLRDLLTRAGIDEGRTRAPLLVPLPDGSSASVVM